MKRYVFIHGVVIIFMIVQSAFTQSLQPPPKTLAVDSSQQIADKIVNSPIPVLIDFWAVWCGPCKLLNPIISELEKEYKGKISFVKVNVDIHKSLASYFQVQAIPAVFLVHNKSVVKYLPGLQPKEVYTGAIQEVIALAKNTKTPSDTTKK